MNINLNEYKRQQKKFEILDAMGIQIWKESDLISPFSTSNIHHNQQLMLGSQALPYQPKLNTACWVLLHGTIDTSELALVKILEGMLKVLQLSADSYCISSIPQADQAYQSGEDKEDFLALLNTLLKWYPQTVLVLGFELGQALLEAAKFLEGPLPFVMRVTYHPKELMIEPQKKREAYQTLLELKGVM